MRSGGHFGLLLAWYRSKAESPSALSGKTGGENAGATEEAPLLLPLTLLPGSCFGNHLLYSNYILLLPELNKQTEGISFFSFMGMCG